MDNETPTSITTSTTPRRISSKFVKRLHKQFKNALRKVKELKASILNIDTVLSKGYKVVTRRRAEVHVNLSNPELLGLVDKKNILTLKLTKAVKEKKKCESRYLDAVRRNSDASRKSLSHYRIMDKEGHVLEITAEIQEELQAAALKGFLNAIVNLKQLVVTEGVTPAFKKGLVDILKKAGRSDLRFIPVASGIQIAEYLKQLDISVNDKPDLE